MNLIAKLRHMQRQIDDLKRRLDAAHPPEAQLTPTIDTAHTIVSADTMLAPPVAKRRGRPPKPRPATT